MSTSRRPFTFDRVVRIVGSVLILAGAVWLINVLKNVLLPFCLACLVAYMLQPVVSLNGRIFHIKRHAINVVLTLFEVAALVGLSLYFVLPMVISEIGELTALIDRYRTNGMIEAMIPEEFRLWLDRISSQLSISQLADSGQLEEIITGGTSVVSYVIDMFMHTIEWLLAFVYVIFIMIDYDELVAAANGMIPPDYRPITVRIGRDIQRSMNSYFRGQALIALCAAVFYSIGFSIVGIPMAIVLGVTVGILYMIPYFQYVTLIPVAIVCFISTLGGDGSFWIMMGQCILVYVVSQSICDYVLTPHIMGSALGLHPAIILLSLSIWGTLLGIIGMIIALPLTALLIAYYREFVIEKHTITKVKSSGGKQT
ncbi:MAG: AI-2E family transporter [Bacteroides sp.]|nr:AI-2E family transporter [Bacteroides sp.]